MVCDHFCRLAPGLLLAAVVPGHVAAQPAYASGSAPRCHLQAELVAVVHDSQSPARSFAMVSYGSGPNALVTLGSRVGDRSVVAITPWALWLRNADDTCWLPLSHEAPARKARAPGARNGRRGRK